MKSKDPETLFLTPTKRGAWMIQYGKFSEVMTDTDTITIVRPKQRNDVLMINGFLIEAKKGRK